jgi:hypothetical protein
MSENLEEILSACLDRLIAGASLQEALAGQPEQIVAALTPALLDAQMLLRSDAAVESSGAREQAKARMFGALDAARVKERELHAPAAGVVAATAAGSGAVNAKPGWLAAFMRRPASFRAAAVAGSVAVFGVLGVGAAAATGNAPEPVRELFRSSATNGLRIEFVGLITAADPVATTFTVQIGDDVRVVRVVESTELSRGGDDIAFGDFAAGDFVEVKGALQPDDTIVASRVHMEDGDDRTAEPGVTTTPDDDDDAEGDDDENSGPGNADDGDDDDNSGPGDGDDDDDDSGPNNADDADDDDSSGPGDSDDGGGDDDSGTGSGDDGDDDSGPGSDDDLDDDDDGNSGSGNTGDDDELDDDDDAGDD